MPVDLDDLFQDGAGQPLKLDASHFIAKGGVGEVYAHPTDPNSCIKLYITERSARLHAQKLPDMIALPPDNITTSPQQGSVQQLAWPRDTISRKGVFAGFVMPRLAVQETWEFAKLDHPLVRGQYGTPDSLRYRLMLVRNLAGVLHGLHEKGHFVIDLQPKNILAYQWRDGASTPRSGFVALIDSDGFSIAGKRGTGTRHDAAALFPDIACPRAINRLSPTKADVSRLVGFERQQDLWAFAMVTFRMLNAGLWAWDSRPKPGRSLPATPAERIIDLDRTYAYGRVANQDFDAPGNSRHPWFSPALRDLFERTFTTSPNEPTLVEWVKLLDGLLDERYRCDKSGTHWKLGDECGECAIEARAAVSTGQISMGGGQSGHGGGSTAGGQGGQGGGTSQGRGTSHGGGTIQTGGQVVPKDPPKWLAGIGVLGLVIGGVLVAERFDMPFGLSGPSAEATSTTTGAASGEPALPLKWERKIRLNPYLLVEELAIPQKDYWRTAAAMTELVNRANQIDTGSEPVLECNYAGPGYDRLERYWYKTRPAAANEGELAAFQPDHLFLSIRPPVDACPAYWQGADESWEIKRNLGASRRAQAKREVDFMQLRSGQGGTPTIKDRVLISFVGSLPDGQVVDRGTSVWQDVGDAGPPMAVALQRMQRGGTYAVTLSPELEGDKFRTPFRPAGGVVRYEITLLDFVPDSSPAAGAEARGVEPENAEHGESAGSTNFSGKWRGTYVCRGITAGVFLDLTRRGNAISGVFAFYPVTSDDRRALAGSFNMSGTSKPGARDVIMTPGSWNSRPAGYRSLPVRLRIDAAGTALTGDFPGTGECSNLRVTRTNGSPPAASTARPSAPRRQPSESDPTRSASDPWRYPRTPGTARQRQEQHSRMPQLPIDEFQRQ
jgi:uncharacterized membrane protein YgcG